MTAPHIRRRVFDFMKKLDAPCSATSPKCDQNPFEPSLYTAKTT